MNNLPVPIQVDDENDPSETSNSSSASEVASTPRPPELLRAFVYREPTGLPSQDDDDSHPHRRRSDRVPQK